MPIVVSANLRRRHLNKSQRAMFAARHASTTAGGDRVSGYSANLPNCASSQAEAVKLEIWSAISVKNRNGYCVLFLVYAILLNEIADCIYPGLMGRFFHDEIT